MKVADGLLNLVRDVRAALRAGDQSTARRLMEEVDASLGALDAPDEESSTLFNTIADTYRKLGDPVRCEAAARAALTVEERLGRPEMLGNHRMFLAMFLADQGRWDEAKVLARTGVLNYRDAYGSGHSETLAMLTEFERIARRTPRAS